MTLKEFAKIALDIERDKSKIKICESCNLYPSSFLYLVKSQIYGIFHICQGCQVEVEKLNGSDMNEITAFVKKDFSTYQ